MKFFTSGMAREWMEDSFIRFFVTTVFIFAILLATLSGAFLLISMWKK